MALVAAGERTAAAMVPRVAAAAAVAAAAETVAAEQMGEAEEARVAVAAAKGK